MTGIEVRAAGPGDDVAGALAAEWGGTVMAVHGRLFDLVALPAFVAVDRPEIVGVLTYELRGDVLEIVSCHAGRRGAGVGRALVRACARAGVQSGATTVCCTTTNDNTGALAFWQRMGLRLVALRPGAVDEARATLKPSIPLVGDHGIGLHDELDLRGDAARCGVTRGRPRP